MIQTYAVLKNLSAPCCCLKFNQDFIEQPSELCYKVAVYERTQEYLNLKNVHNDSLRE